MKEKVASGFAPTYSMISSLRSRGTSTLTAASPSRRARRQNVGREVGDDEVGDEVGVEVGDEVGGEVGDEVGDDEVGDVTK